eukprot:1767189-Heterocapsa_arctica.AAC.1
MAEVVRDLTHGADHARAGRPCCPRRLLRQHRAVEPPLRHDNLDRALPGGCPYAPRADGAPQASWRRGAS